jgi:valyl-tRNA synthetase
MHVVFSTVLRLLHPVMPFLTEELWHTMGYGSEDESIMTAPWPVTWPEHTAAEWGLDPACEQYVDEKHDLVRVGRTLRADYGIVPARRIEYIVKPQDSESETRLREDTASLETLLKAEPLRIDASLKPDRPMPLGVTPLGTIYMPLEGLVDVDAEIERLSGQLDKVSSDLERSNRKLGNMDFVTKAAPDVVERERGRKEELLKQRDKLVRLTSTLEAMKSGS